MLQEAGTSLPPQFLDDDQNLPKHRHAVKDYFPIYRIICHGPVRHLVLPEHFLGRFR